MKWEITEIAALASLEILYIWCYCWTDFKRAVKQYFLNWRVQPVMSMVKLIAFIIYLGGLAMLFWPTIGLTIVMVGMTMWLLLIIFLTIRGMINGT